MCGMHMEWSEAEHGENGGEKGAGEKGRHLGSKADEETVEEEWLGSGGQGGGAEGVDGACGSRSGK